MIFISYPSELSLALVLNVTSATETIEDNASPLKPSVLILSKLFSLSFDVACLLTAFFKSSSWMPIPSSDTEISVLPPSLTIISITFALASRLFSTNSLMAEAGLSTTSPAAI